MENIVLTVFVIGYLCIALEHPIKINKTASALITGVLCWALFALMGPGEWLANEAEFVAKTSEFTTGVNGSPFNQFVRTELSHHLGEIASILFFLMGAMTIVELIDAHEGFRFITDRIKTKDVRSLLWVVCWVTFFLSALLDNLTTSIVMVSLIRKLIPQQQQRLFFAGMIIIAANAGGAWSPIGDVTTTMLWIGGQISTVAIIKSLIAPSIVCLLVPLIYVSFNMKGSLEGTQKAKTAVAGGAGKIMLIVGVSALISVPIFKSVTHLPPYMGMLLGLGVLWVLSEFINPHADEEMGKRFTVSYALTRIDVPSVLFFLGILLAVGALQSMHILATFSAQLDQALGDQRIIITLIGMISAIVDNVPLVAASMGMYSMEAYPVDDTLWHYLAYCAGTGGSLLVIGSAAGVAVMGMEKLDFIWYLKRISFLALLGYAGGAVFYLLTYSMFN